MAFRNQIPASPSPCRQNDRPAARLRVGAVSYLNTKPLVCGLGTSLDLEYDLPSRLADRLASGSLDVALIPVIELPRSGGRMISDACIGCRGPVMSVKLFFRTAPQRVTTLALDEGSRTSAALARILLEERFGVRPRIEPLAIGDDLGDTDADAVLLIGDRAIGPHGGLAGSRGSFQLVWDLGDEWCRWTGLPFVFAVWAARPGVDVGRLPDLLAEARDRGLASLAAIAAAEAPRHALTVPQCLSYLRDNLHYHVGPREMLAMERFRRHAESIGLTAGPISSQPANEGRQDAFRSETHS